MLILENYPQFKIVQDLAKKRKVAIYLVGGFLRDYLLKRQQMDFDFAVSKDAIGLAKAFAKSIKGAFVLLDSEHGCARVVKKDNGQIATFDFADFRDKTFKGDLAHRDFTINTLSLDCSKLKSSSAILDLLADNKSALKDLKAGRIKMTSPNAFKDDPLRMLRAFSLKAMLDFKIEPKTLVKIKKERDLLRGVSYERIRDEFFKILETPRAADNLRAMDKIGLLEKIIPQVHVMFNCKQGGYHHLDVWLHSLETIFQVEKVFEEFKNDSDIEEYLEQKFAGTRTRKSLIKLALLLHDIGKPETRKIENSKYSFHGHEHVGKNITRIVAKMLKLSKQERFVVQDMVQWHLRPGYLSNFEKPSEKSIYRYFRDTKQEAASILLLSLADQRSTRGPLTTKRDQTHHYEICTRLLKQYFEKLKEKPFTCFINGNDLIKELKLKPSPLFGEILTKVAEQQSLGKIESKDQAIELASKLANRHSESRRDEESQNT